METHSFAFSFARFNSERSAWGPDRKRDTVVCNSLNMATRISSLPTFLLASVKELDKYPNSILVPRMSGMLLHRRLNPGIPDSAIKQGGRFAGTPDQHWKAYEKHLHYPLCQKRLWWQRYVQLKLTANIKPLWFFLKRHLKTFLTWLFLDLSTLHVVFFSVYNPNPLRVPSFAFAIWSESIINIT